MKLIAGAAALMLAGTAMAQTMTPAPITPADTTVTQGTVTPADPGTTPAPAETDPPASSDMSTATIGDPPGGYASTPTVSGLVTTGQPIINAPSPSPAEAFPAPAPLKHYPICKKGQYDDCMQRGG